MKLTEWLKDKGVESVVLDELVHELKASEAADINNGGIDDQSRYIREYCGDDEQAIIAVDEFLSR